MAVHKRRSVMKRIDTLYGIARQAQIAAVTLAMMVALAGFANAQSTSSHSHKKGMLEITHATEVGGTVLQPGEYTVRETRSTDGPVVEFLRVVHNEQASELVQADEEELVARVTFTPHVLSAPSKQTELQIVSNADDATRLEIRGNPVAYSFTPSPLNAER